MSRKKPDSKLKTLIESELIQAAKELTRVEFGIEEFTAKAQQELNHINGMKQRIEDKIKQYNEALE